MTILTLPNGTTLDDSHESAKMLAAYASEHGISQARVFLTDDHGVQSFLLVIGEKPEFESQQVEAVAAHLDALALAKS